MKAVEVLVSEFLVPTKEERTKRELQQSWLNGMQSVKRLVEGVIFSVTNNVSSLYGAKSKRIVNEVR